SLGCRGPLARTVVRITGGPVRRGLRTLAHCRGTSGVSAWWQGRGWFADAPAPSRGPGPPHDRGGRSAGFGPARGRGETAAPKSRGDPVMGRFWLAGGRGQW